jgi:hypothetical protein
LKRFELVALGQFRRLLLRLELHLLGVEHTRLTYRFEGRDYRLTDVSGEVVKAILA